MTANTSAARAGRPLRFGLAGTGHWARTAHAPALGSTPGIEFAAVWGRNRKAAAELAAGYQAVAHDDFDAFLNGLDGVSFSIPPDVQSELGLRAAKAGKHVLLEKPIATSIAAADMLAQAVTDAQVASVVFFIARFQPDVRAWLADVSEQAWMGGNGVWLGSALAESSPFNTPWRRVKGGLWDLGPHAVSLLWASLGPVVSVTADAGLADVSYLVLHHESGAASSVTLTLSGGPAAGGFEMYLWGEQGRSVAPPQSRDSAASLGVALTELAHNARSGGVQHPCDVRFGRDVTRVLSWAQEQIDKVGEPQ